MGCKSCIAHSESIIEGEGYKSIMSKKSIKSSKNLRCNSVWNRSGRHHCQVSGLRCLCSCCSCSPVGHLCQVRVLPWSVRVLPQVSQSVIITNLTQLHISYSTQTLAPSCIIITDWNYQPELGSAAD